MFGNVQNVGNQPNQPPTLPMRSRPKRLPNVGLLEWKTEIFLAKGWKSKAPAQMQMCNEMRTACDLVEASVLQPDIGDNCYAKISKEELEAGKEFEAYLLALNYFENALPKMRTKYAEDLQTAAQKYVDHFDKSYSKRQKKQPQNIRKKEICDATLSDLRKFDLRDQLNEMPDPPWDTETAMKASALKVTLDIESMPPGTKGVEKNGGVHEFPAYWINKKGNNGGTDKSFLFKPTTDQSMNGFDKGGDTVRESAVGRMGDLLNGMTGLDFGVPDTHVVSVGKDKLPEGPLGDGVAPPVGETYVGSVQQFASSGGELREQPREEIEKVSPESCQKMALLDMLTLNLDRHGGNLMVKPDQGHGPELVPIDHGQAFPPFNKLTISDIANKLGDRHCATLSLPGSHEPFTDEMLEAIESLDPDAMAEGMRREVATIGKAHPSTAGKITDESIEMSRRSAKFLKLAVDKNQNPKLTAAAAQVAFGQNAEALLAQGLDDQAFEDMAQEIIVKAAANQPGLAEYFLLSPEMQDELHTELVDNGWPRYNGALDRKWLLQNTKLALNLARGDVRHPGKMQELEDILGKQQLAQRLTQQTLSSLYDNFYTLIKRPDLTKEDEENVDKLEQVFSGRKISRALPALMFQASQEWQAFDAMGGVNALNDAIEELGLNGSAETRARTNITDALAAIRDVAGMQNGALLAANVNLDVKAAEAEFDYIQRIAAELPQGNKIAIVVQNFGKRAATGSAEEKKRLRTLRVKVSDAVRKDALARLKIVEKRIEAALDTADENNSEEIKFALKDVMDQAVGIASGVILGASKTVADWEQKYPN